MLKDIDPVNFLNQLAEDRGIVHHYLLETQDEENQDHSEPMFIFKIIFGNFLGSGSGTTEKEAKYNAAVAILTELYGIICEPYSPIKNDAGSCLSQFD